MCLNVFCQGEFGESAAQMQNEMHRNETSTQEERRTNCDKEKSIRKTNMDFIFFRLQWL